MRIPRIYTSQSLATGTSLELEERAAHYLIQVLRMKAGRQLILFNGDGFDYPAEITEVGRRQLICTLSDTAEKIRSESPLHIELGIAISKGDRMDLVVQKATELGVASITPLFSERVDVKLPEERREKKWQHWQQIMISACEQSGRARLPDLNPITELDNWITEDKNALNLVLCPARLNETGLSHQQDQNIRLLIGPEGGLSDAEIEQALTQGFHTLQLGPRVLRTETAPLAAISILQYRFGDMN
ncbi:16S rRNA (uracil(1498)-N(3))-methyltransferase [Spongiibacter sp. KMU-158]|uniref:Ribosomal RNA small subunit methyltransferase E n=1 Tax=Spongiibacter pelagi TaxID=2760804 RepID=A0A927BZF5_9GAMM|nr:16S rRNA (uracil(1498)-N(3))-methyltransferase [Spongiibacter pelagi]MBD2857378.1 16S rRNA (uracil(1498)-N(3))-methyltransferase [Spongiibacter pelagi]